MIKKTAILIVLVLSFKMITAQVVITDNEQIKGYNSIPQESVFVHFNSSLLFTGEYLYYTLYCFNNKNLQKSDISKIAYIELVGKGIDPIFVQKVKLENGIGSGDFFIPVTVNTGSYKLLAYTNWMKNNKRVPFFESTINIINPYHINQKAYATSDKVMMDSMPSELYKSKPVSTNHNKASYENKSILTLELEQLNYKQRSKVTMVLKGLENDNVSKGNYSVSVKKIGQIPKPNTQDSYDFIEGLRANYEQNEIKINSKVHLPELRGDLISGKVTALTDSLDVSKLKVAISIPGDDYFFQLAETNSLGEFYVNIDREYSSDKIYLQVLGNNRNKFEIKLDFHNNVNLSNLVFNEFILQPNWENEIIERSIHNQIESAYFEFKPDSILTSPIDKMFSNRKWESYNLDDYTRFPTLSETFTEYVKNVSVGKLDKDNYVLKVHGFEFDSNTEIPPLVLVDGVVVQNITDLLNYKASNIKEISVLRDQLVIGIETFQGIIDIKTINGTYENIENESSIFESTIFKPQLKKHYFTQVYTKENQNSRIPDDRYQLLWIPDLDNYKNEEKIEFFTSDVIGEFEINIEGFTLDGKPVSIKKTINVE